MSSRLYRNFHLFHSSVDSKPKYLDFMSVDGGLSALCQASSGLFPQLSVSAQPLGK
jgi:hypothetical protein